jgi:hypothetical protein
LAELCPRPASQLTHVTFGGGEIHKSRILWARRRVSPGSLRASPHHRMLWAVSTLNFCRESWEYLLDRCPACHAALRWTGADALKCAKCARDLRDFNSPQIPEPLRPALAIAADLVAPRGGTDPRQVFPQQLQKFSPTSLLELARAAGKSLSRSKPRLHVTAEEIADGIDLLRGYPSTVTEIYRLRDRRSFEFLSAIELYADRHFTSDIRLFLNCVLREMSQPKATVGEGLRDGRRHFGLLNVTEAAKRLRVDRATLRRMIQLGDLAATPISGSERQHSWLKLEDVDECRRLIDAIISATQIGREVSLPPGAAQVLARHYLIPTAPPKFMEGRSDGPFYERSDALALVARLQRSVARRALDPDRVPLVDLIDRAPLTTLAAAAIELHCQSRLRGALASTGSDGVEPEHLHIHRGSVRKVVMLAECFQARIGWVTWKQALGVLRCGPNALNELLCAGILPHQFGSSIDAVALLNFARTHISIVQLAETVNGRVQAIRSWARRNEIPQITPGVDIFSRATVDAKSADLLAWVSSRKAMGRWHECAPRTEASMASLK